MFTLCQTNTAPKTVAQYFALKTCCSAHHIYHDYCAFEIVQFITEIERVKVEGKTTSTVYFSVMKTTLRPIANPTWKHEFENVKVRTTDVQNQTFNNIQAAFKFAVEHAESTCATIFNAFRTADKAKNSWIVSARNITQVEQLCTWTNPEDTLNPSANYSPALEFSVTINGEYQGFHGNAVELTRLIKMHIKLNRSGRIFHIFNHRLATHIVLKTTETHYEVLHKARILGSRSSIKTQALHIFYDKLDSQI